MKARTRPQRLSLLLTALSALVVIMLGVSGASAAPNLVANGDFSSFTGAFQLGSFSVASTSTHGTWLHSGQWSSVAGGPDGNYAKHALKGVGDGTNDQLFQGFPLAGTGVASGDSIDLSFRYVNEDYPETFAGEVLVYGFGASGAWSRFAPWGTTDGTLLASSTLSKVNAWTAKTLSFTLPTDYAALAVGFRLGFQGSATVERLQGIDSVVLSLSVSPEIKVEKSAAAEYFVADGPVEYRYEVTNPGNVPLSNVAVSDDECGTASYVSGDANTDTLLDTDETWVFSCSYTPTFTGPSSVLDNVATATGEYDESTVSDKDGFKLLGAVIRKNVHLYWQAGGPDKFVPYDAPGVYFDVQLYERGVGMVGTEQVAEDDPLELWLTLKPSNASGPGWRFVEQPKTGYPVADARGEIGFNVVPGGGYLDSTLINTIDFDLGVVKSGPKLVGESGYVKYTYTVTNAGPAAVTPVVTDDVCPGVEYKSGDANTDGLIQPSETWVFRCSTTLTWHFGWDFGTGAPACDTNTATVVDEEQPDPSFWSPWEFYGGDVNASNDTDTYTLCPWILRKDVREYGTGAQVSDPKTFVVKVKEGTTVVGTVTIAEGDPARFWLAPGTYGFREIVVSPYVPNFEYWTQEAGVDYPDWTVVNYRWNGCSHGFWKNHATAPPWPPGYLAKTVGEVFPASEYYDAKTLLEALSLKGGGGVKGAEQILLKQAAAALLNEVVFGASFGDFTYAQLVSAVNAALSSGDRSTMIDLAEALDHWNNGYCAL